MLWGNVALDPQFEVTFTKTAIPKRRMSIFIKKPKEKKCFMREVL